MARTKQNQTQTRRSRSGVRARDRIAGDRAARRRAQARRRFLVSTAAVGAVLAIVAGLVAVKLTAGSAAASETLAPQRVERQVSTVPVAVLARVHSGGTLTRLQAAKVPGPILRIGGKPAIVFVSEESCPFCAAERWPLAVALSHFGTWSHLGATRSSATDVFPNTATLSFRGAGYRSRALTLRTTELADSRGRPLQRLTTLDNTLMRAYDVPLYVNTADMSIPPTSPEPSRSSTSVTATSWPGRNTIRRFWPGCPSPRSPANSALHPVRWPRRSTAQPR